MFSSGFIILTLKITVIILSYSDLLTFSTDHCKVEIHADIVFDLCSHSPAHSLVWRCPTARVRLPRNTLLLK